MEEEIKKKSLFDVIDEHPKTVFSIRLVLWVLFSAILPIMFIAWRYDIFKPQGKLKLTGFGIIAVIIAAVFLITLVKYIYLSLKPGLVKQCIAGLCSIVIPLIIVYVLVSNIADTIDLFKQALGCVIVCETVGIPLNPFPAWIEKIKEKRGEDKAKGFIATFVEEFFTKRKKWIKNEFYPRRYRINYYFIHDRA